MFEKNLYIIKDSLLNKLEIVMEYKFYYDEHTIISNDDQTIACHPYVDQCNSLIIYKLLEYIGIPCKDRVILEVGTGTGQMTRILLGIPGLLVEACDIDSKVEDFFKANPETKGVRFYTKNAISDDFPRHYDAIICRGVYHHIPKSKRSQFISNLCKYAKVVIIADEAIKEYNTAEEREKHLNSWYGYVINEAKRRNLLKLAEAETNFLNHEKLDTADDGGDFKESPNHFLNDAKKVNLNPVSFDKIGDYEKNKGGFFVATFLSSNS